MSVHSGFWILHSCRVLRLVMLSVNEPRSIKCHLGYRIRGIRSCPPLSYRGRLLYIFTLDLSFLLAAPSVSHPQITCTFAVHHKKEQWRFELHVQIKSRMSLSPSHSIYIPLLCRRPKQSHLHPYMSFWVRQMIATPEFS